MTGRNLIAKGVEQMLHFRAPFALSQLVARSKGRCPAVWRRSIRRIRLTRQLADLSMLQRVMMRARNGI